MQKIKFLILLLTVLAASGCSRQNSDEQVIKNVDNAASRTDVITADAEDNKTKDSTEKGTPHLFPAYITDREENKYGYIDENGVFTINPIYDQASDFSEGFAVVYDS